MPLFDLSAGPIKPFRRLNSAAEVYEAEIESLLWTNLEAFAGEPLFALARQAKLPGGGIPDILALDAQGRVTIIEVKRDVDRSQLAQALEYAGWARSTNLDELAGLYGSGPEQFFKDWQDFTSTSSPLLLNNAPRLLLVARSFHARTASALDYLLTAGVPWRKIRVVFYEDDAGNRIVDVDNGDSEVITQPSGASGTSGTGPNNAPPGATAGVKLIDLLEAGLIEAGEHITWKRPQIGQLHHATINSSGAVLLPDGRTFTSLSTAADTLTGGSHNGWEVWAVPRLGGVKIGVLRSQLLAASQPTSD